MGSCPVDNTVVATGIIPKKNRRLCFVARWSGQACGLAQATRGETKYWTLVQKVIRTPALATTPAMSTSVSEKLTVVISGRLSSRSSRNWSTLKSIARSR